MNIEDLSTAGFDAMIELGGAEVKIGTKTYRCVCDDDDFGKVLEDGGFMEQHTFHVYVRKTDFTKLPEVNEIITVGPVQYRIFEIMTSPGDPTLRLKCGTIQK